MRVARFLFQVEGGWRSPGRDLGRGGNQETGSRSASVGQIEDIDAGAEVVIIRYASVLEARAGFGRYIAFYNSVRPHSALGDCTLNQVYFDQPVLAAE